MAEDIKSRYELLAVPDFKSAIPAHLLGKLTDQERYLVETLSKMEQTNSWLIVAVVKANTATIDLDKRQTIVEQWRDRLMSRWTLVAGIGVVLLPWIAEKIWAYFSKKGP